MGTPVRWHGGKGQQCPLCPGLPLDGPLQSAALYVTSPLLLFPITPL